MAENKNSFIKSRMNKDLDDRIIPSNEYRDGQNIAVSRSEDQDVGALESILGNELVFDTSTYTSAKTIGSYVDERNGFIYYFATDFTATNDIPNALSTNFCAIYRWSPTSGNDTPTVLAQGSFLNFSTTSPMLGVSLLESLLFFTDNRNQPRNINVVTADLDVNNTYYKDEESITVCKFFPYEAPQLIDLRSISSLKPSTMSNAENLPVIRVNSVIWATENLDVTRYRNGDLITNAVTFTEWNTNNANEIGCWAYYKNNLANGVVYQKLYNSWAVKDTRGLAPFGYTIADEANYTDLNTQISSSGVASIKSTDNWTTTSSASNNSTGFDSQPSGERTATSAAVDFQEIKTKAKYWLKDGLKYYSIADSNSTPTIETATVNPAGTTRGYAVRVVQDSGFKGWSGDPVFIKDKFVRFSYRFKFDDGEYSLIAPFTQDCYIPLQEGRFVNDDEDNAMRSTIIDFMQNSINNIILNIELPSLDIINDYKIEDIDIIYKESDALNYKILQTVPIDTVFISNLNYTNIYQYTYESTVPFKTLPSDETTRVFDKVPVRALAQEIAGNRVMYSNFVQGYNAPLSLNYAAGKIDKNAQEFEEYPQHSLKQNRNYQVGVILADKWGRQTDVILSSKDNVLVAGGEPTEGSNFFSTYRPIENSSEIIGWLGDTLTARFDEVVSVNGEFSGLYAIPTNFQAISPFTSPFPEFLNLSVQVLNTVAAQAAYTFANISVQDIGTNNIFTLWLDKGLGWVLIPATSYGVTDNGDDESVVTFTSGAPAIANYKLKAQLLYSSQYRYQIKNITNANTIFIVNRKLRGKYQDYVEIKIASGTTTRDIRTNYEISDTYMFIGDSAPSSNSTRRVETRVTTTVSHFVYNINVTGFYSYRIVVKQQEQEYYNVYLPGIIDGYPIQGNTTEIGDTAFLVLTHDNINKVPRELNDVGNQDTQYNSNLSIFGRVTNFNGAVSNKQYGPSTTPDIVELIGSIQKVFPDVEYDGTAGTAPAAEKINNNAIFDIDQKPFIAKVNTQKSIGIPQGDYNSQAVGEEYPDFMDLSVYETAPTVSNLDLFYETSTTGLISDLNYSISTAGTAITGLSPFTWLHNEGDCAGSPLTTAFFALTPGGNDVTSTAAFLSVYSFDPSTEEVITSVNRMNEFVLVSAGGGAFRIDLGASTVAGVPHAALTNFEYLQRYQFTIQFTQDDGTTSTQQFTRQLANDPPVIDLTQAPQPNLLDTKILKWDGYSQFNSSGPGVVRGYNGSCAPCNRTVDLEWSIESCRWQNASGVFYSYVSGQNQISPYSDTDVRKFYFKKGEQQINQATCTTADNENFFGLWVERTNANGVGGTLLGDFQSATLHEITVKLTDKNGTDESQTLAIQYTPIATSYTGVVANWYTSNIAAGQPGYVNPATQWQSPPTGATGITPGCATSSSTAVLPTWVGEVANWTNSIQYIYAKVVKTSNSNFVASFSGYNTTTALGFTAPAFGDGTKAFDGPVSISNSIGSDSYQIIATLQAFNPSQAQINLGVSPGDSGTDPVTGASYDWSECCLINCRIDFTTVDTCSVPVSLTLVYDTVGNQNPPPNPQLVAPASGAPPFASSAWFKSSNWPS